MSEFEKYLCPQCGTMQESLKAELARLTAELAELRERTRWISVTERLPVENGLFVRAQDDKGMEYIAGHNNVGWFTNRHELIRNIVCWQPISPTEDK